MRPIICDRAESIDHLCLDRAVNVAPRVRQSKQSLLQFVVPEFDFGAPDDRFNIRRGVIAVDSFGIVDTDKVLTDQALHSIYVLTPFLNQSSTFLVSIRSLMFVSASITELWLDIIFFSLTMSS